MFKKITLLMVALLGLGLLVSAGTVGSANNGAEDMLLSEIDFQPDAEMVTIEIPDPMWGAQGTS